MQEIKLLDHGFIRLVDIMGTDSSICQAARVSYGDGTKTVREDEKLINYLWKNAHTSPFEMCELKFHVKCPIFVARQYLRHRTASVNEYSARYSVVKDDYYVPEPSVVKGAHQTNKQSRGQELPDETIKTFIQSVKYISDGAYFCYKASLESGIARELARMMLPVNFYTEFYWKMDLHNLLRFIKLRAHPHAQYEIRVYAEALLDIVKEKFPMTYNAYIANAHTTS